MKPEHRSLCAAIVDLENYENEKFLQHVKAKTTSKLPYQLNRKIIGLVGEKPVLKAELDKVQVECLWDTGSMVSIMSE